MNPISTKTTMKSYTVWDAIISKCVIGKPDPLINEFGDDTVEVSKIEHDAVQVGDMHSFTDTMHGSLTAIVESKNSMERLSPRPTTYELKLKFFCHIS